MRAMLYSIFIILLLLISHLSISYGLGSWNDVPKSCVTALEQSSHVILNEDCSKILVKKIISEKSLANKVASGIFSLAYVVLLVFIGGNLGGMINHHHTKDTEKKQKSNKIDTAKKADNDDDSGLGKKAAIGFATALIGVPFLISFIGIEYNAFSFVGVASDTFVLNSMKVLGLSGLCGFLGTKLIANLALNVLSKNVEKGNEKLKEVNSNQETIYHELENLLGYQLYEKGVESLNIYENHKKHKTEEAAKNGQVSNAELQQIDNESIKENQLNIEKSKDHFLKSIKLFKDKDEKADAHGQLAYVNKRLGNLKQAVMHARNAVQLVDNLLWHYNYLCYLVLTDTKGLKTNEIIEVINRLEDLVETSSQKIKGAISKTILIDLETGDFHYHPEKSKIEKPLLELKTLLDTSSKK